MTTAPSPGHIPEIRVGDRLRRAREDAGWTQREFAQLVGATQKTVSNAETGQREPRRLLVNAWSLVTGVPVQWLLTGEVSHPNGPTDVPPAGFEPATHGLERRRFVVADLTRIRPRHVRQAARPAGWSRTTSDILAPVG